MKPGFLLTSDKKNGLFNDKQSKQSSSSSDTITGWENYSVYETLYYRSLRNKINGNNTDSLVSNPPLTHGGDLKSKWIDGPLFPNSISSPVLTLNNWYSARHKIMLTSDPYTYWNDKNPKDNLLRHTCAFRCPRTDEIFFSGRYGNPNRYEVREEISNGIPIEVVWYTKKKYAQHAVAARVLDCYSYRDNECNIAMCFKLCQEEPYAMNISMTIPSSAPEIPVVAVQMQETQIKDDEQYYQDRAEYRNSRLQKMDI
jgi:hypothetical protein